MSQPTALSRRKLVLAPAATLLAIAGLTLLFAPNLGAALKRVGSIPLSAFALTLALGVAAIGLRAEIWRLCLRALGSVCQSRTDLHACSAMTFVANQANHYVGPFARIGLLRRLYGERAPRPLQLVACDLSVLLCEIGVVAVILAGSVALAGLPWWMPVAGVALAAVGLTGLAGARRRFARHPSSEGLAILADQRLRLRMLALLALAIVFQLTRTWMLLSAAGLHPALWQVGMTFVATGILGALPLGPATCSGATAVVFVGHSTAAAAGAMLLTSSGMIAALLYGTWALCVLVPKLGRLTWRGWSGAEQACPQALTG